MLEVLCYHAQQAAEKAIKAVLVARCIPFPKSNNIRTLLDLLPKDIVPPDEIDDMAILTDYAVISRYPGNLEPVEGEEYREAVRLTEFAVRWAETYLE